MAQHYVVGDSSPFLKRVLLPFWCIRILIMLVYIAIYALALAAVVHYTDELEDEFGQDFDRTTFIASIAVIMVIVIFCLLLDITCIIKRARRTLSPRFFLIVNVIQTTIWTVLFVLAIIGANRGGLAIGISVIVYLSFAGVLIYASVIFHRHRKGTLNSYTQAGQHDISGGSAAHQGFNPNVSYGYASAPAYQTGVEAPKDSYYGSGGNGQQYDMSTSYGYASQTQPQGPTQGQDPARVA